MTRLNLVVLMAVIALPVFGQTALTKPQLEVLKKESTALQESIDTTVSSVVAGPLLQPARAAYIEGYGLVVALEVALELPPRLFGPQKTPAEIRSSVAQRRKDLQEKMTALLKQRVGSLSSIGAAESLAVVINIMNTRPAEVPNLPAQLILTVKKQDPAQVVPREY